MTREEKLLSAIASGESIGFSSATREEVYLSAIANGEKDGLPDPVTRKELLLAEIATKGNGGGSSSEGLSVNVARLYGGCTSSVDGLITIID